MAKALGTQPDEAEERPFEEEPMLTPEPPADNTPSKFRASELIELSEQKTGQPNFFAAGAMAHAGIANDEMISEDDFKKYVEAFKEVGAF